jgi:uncharacterized phiE125 gp8 family phage protein
MALTASERENTYGMEVQTKTDTGREPVNVEEVKSYIGLSGTEKDGELNLIIAAAREAVERKYGISLKAKTYEVYVREPGSYVDIPHPPTESVSEVVSIDSEGTETALTLNTDFYLWGNKELKMELTDRSYPVKFEAVSGPDAITAGQKFALIKLCKQMYDGDWMPGEKIPNDIHATFATYGKNKW